MENDWKGTLGEYFGNMGIHRVKYLNEKLMSNCMEYVAYLNEFEGVSAKLESYRQGFIQGGATMCIEISTDTKHYKQFKLSCIFNNSGNLILVSTTDYDYNLFPSAQKEAGDNWTYQEEELSEPERVEKEYQFESFSIRLKNYIEKLRPK